MREDGQSINIIGICGSTRTGSYNQAILKAAASFFPNEVIYKEAPLSTLPFYSQDLELDLPEEVASFVELVRRADGLLMSSPESGVQLFNARGFEKCT